MPTRQVGVLPYRTRRDAVEVLLVTSRKRRRWICPKGNVEADLGPQRTAHLEAFEEAGVEGTLVPPPLGVYLHGSAHTDVLVFLLKVDAEHATWPEADARDRKWLPLQDARHVVAEDGLRRLLSEAERRLAARR